MPMGKGGRAVGGTWSPLKLAGQCRRSVDIGWRSLLVFSDSASGSVHRLLDPAFPSLPCGGCGGLPCVFLYARMRAHLQYRAPAPLIAGNWYHFDPFEADSGVALQAGTASDVTSSRFKMS